jgi:hypothetical protein
VEVEVVVVNKTNVDSVVEPVVTVASGATSVSVATVMVDVNASFKSVTVKVTALL